ncbi:MAG: S8 family serine peptidase [Patescibacteria group bacterium]|jgi:subtilisin family serine protease
MVYAMNRAWLAVGTVAIVVWHSAIPVLADDYVPNEVLVQWKDQPASTTEPFTILPVEDVPTALTVLSQDPRVQLVEPNFKRYLSVLPNTLPLDPYYPSQWHLEQNSDVDIDAATAWNSTTGDSAIIVAIIDTGIDPDHPDLVDNIWTNSGEIPDNNIDDDGNGYVDDEHGWDFINHDNNPSAHPTSDSFSSTYVRHGTHVAGLIGATGNNSVGVTGVNWTVSLMPLKVFTENGESDVSAVTSAVNYAIANGADVISMSYGGTSFSAAEQAVLLDASNAGIVLVAAAGNELLNLNTIPYYPICYDNVIGVGATDSSDDMAWFSNYGADCVDLAAPGDNILSTFYVDADIQLDLTDEYGYMSGTSMATPIVSGAAALLLAADNTLTPAEVAAALLNNVDDINVPALGAGRLNVAQALATVVAEAGPSAVDIEGYGSSSKQTHLTSGVRTTDATPYFYWSEPLSPADVVGYYVYFGQDSVDPVTAGVLQSNRSYLPVGLLSGNEKYYELRVKTIDSENRVSALAQYNYVIDTIVKRPAWRIIKETTTGVELRWYKPKNEHVVGYKIYRSRIRSGQYKSFGLTVKKTSYLDTNVLPDKRYYYKVRAIDDLGNISSMSEIKTIKL